MCTAWQNWSFPFLGKGIVPWRNGWLVVETVRHSLHRSISNSSASTASSTSIRCSEMSCLSFGALLYPNQSLCPNVIGNVCKFRRSAKLQVHGHGTWDRSKHKHKLQVYRSIPQSQPSLETSRKRNELNLLHSFTMPVHANFPAMIWLLCIS